MSCCGQKRAQQRQTGSAFVHELAAPRASAGRFPTGRIYFESIGANRHHSGRKCNGPADVRPKYGLAFSPDGSEIAYTVLPLRILSAGEWAATLKGPHDKGHCSENRQSYSTAKVLYPSFFRQRMWC